MNASLPNSIDSEIICSVVNLPGVGILRSIDEALTYMNTSAMELFKFRTMEEVYGFPRRDLFAGSSQSLGDAVPGAAESTYQECILFKTNQQTYFRGSLLSATKITEGHVINDEIIVYISPEAAGNAFDHANQIKSSHELTDSIPAGLRSPLSTLLGLIGLMKHSSASGNYNYLGKMSTHINVLQAQARNLPSSENTATE